MNTIRTKNAKRLLLFILPFIPFVIFLNSNRTNVVTLYAEYPTEVIAGASFPITITIEKGNLDGFGRFSHVLPEGFFVECDAQNFEFEDNTVKLLWVNLPYTSSFTFTYTVFVPETYSGSLTITANFGYVLDNQRRFAELIPQNISVINDPLALRRYLAQIEARKRPVRPEDITAYRTIEFLPSHDAVVSIRVNKRHLKAMSKIEELLPQGYSFYALERENAAFSTQNNVARYMWLEAPDKEIFIVSYKVIANSGYNIKDIYINGAFSYLENGTTHTIPILERNLDGFDESIGRFDPQLSSIYETEAGRIQSRDQLTVSPDRRNVSARAPYDLDPNVISTQIPQTDIEQFPTTTPDGQTIASRPAAPGVQNEPNYIYVDDLETVLLQKDYTKEQVSFFTSTGLSTQPGVSNQTGPVLFLEASNHEEQNNTAAHTQNQALEEQANITFNNQTLQPKGAHPVPVRNTPVPVNIHAIPAPSTYFDDSHTNNHTDPDMVSIVTNPSYNRNMENAGLFGNPQEYTDEYVEPTYATQGRVQGSGTTQQHTQATPAAQITTPRTQTGTAPTATQGAATTQTQTQMASATPTVQANEVTQQQIHTAPAQTTTPRTQTGTTPTATQGTATNQTQAQMASATPSVQANGVTQQQIHTAPAQTTTPRTQTGTTPTATQGTATNQTQAQMASATPSVQANGVTQQQIHTAPAQTTTPRTQTGTTPTATQGAATTPTTQAQMASATPSVQANGVTQQQIHTAPAQTTTPRIQTGTTPTATQGAATTPTTQAQMASATPSVQANGVTQQQIHTAPAQTTTPRIQTGTTPTATQGAATTPTTQAQMASATPSVQANGVTQQQIHTAPAQTTTPRTQTGTATTATQGAATTPTTQAHAIIQPHNQQTPGVILPKPSNQTQTHDIAEQESTTRIPAPKTTPEIPAQTTNPIIIQQDIIVSQAELAFHSNLDIPGTQQNNIVRDQQTQQNIQTREQQTVTSVALGDNERTTPRLTNKNNVTQQETRITRVQQEQGGLHGVYYRIQISASSKLVNVRSYFRRFKIRDRVIVEQIDGWFKYSVQKYDTYILARNYRNSIWNTTPVNDAFVVAYNGEKRITVQEALMITNQKWER